MTAMMTKMTAKMAKMRKRRIKDDKDDGERLALCDGLTCGFTLALLSAYW